MIGESRRRQFWRHFMLADRDVAVERGGGKRERAGGQVRQNMRGRGGEGFHCSEHITRGKKSPITSHIWQAMAARFRWAKESFRGSKCAAPKGDLSYVFMIYLLEGFLEITRRMLAAVKDVEVDFLPLLFIGLNTRGPYISTIFHHYNTV